MITPENYRAFPAVANSDLGWLHDLMNPREEEMDPTRAYALGSLLDAMITQAHKVDYFNKKILGESYPYTEQDFKTAEEMKRAFYRDTFCQQFVNQCHFQHICYNPEFNIQYQDIAFVVPAKCMFDLYGKTMDLSGDIKTTTASTAKQCEEAFRHFEYYRQAAWYMDIGRKNNMVYIFISKQNHKVFKIPIQRGDELYRQGRARYQELAYHYAQLFGDIGTFQVKASEVTES